MFDSYYTANFSKFSEIPKMISNFFWSKWLAPFWLLILYSVLRSCWNFLIWTKYHGPIKKQLCMYITCNLRQTILNFWKQSCGIFFVSVVLSRIDRRITKLNYDHISKIIYCLKSVRIRSFSGPYFHSFGLNDRQTPNTDTFYSVILIIIKSPYHALHSLPSFKTNQDKETQYDRQCKWQGNIWTIW